MDNRMRLEIKRTCLFCQHTFIHRSSKPLRLARVEATNIYHNHLMNECVGPAITPAVEALLKFGTNYTV